MEPSKFLRIKRTARFTLKVAVRVRKKIPGTTRYTSRLIKKGMRVSEKFAQRFPTKVKSTQYMEIEERQPRYDPQTRKQIYGKWKVTSRQKMNFYEQILPLKDITSRHLRTTFAKYRIFSNIWQNHKGIIRMSVNGHVEGRRVKEVIHIGYLKSVWETRHNGYSEFKDYLVNKVLQALRRKHLRLSNPKESRERLIDLYRKRTTALRRLETSPSWNKETALEGYKEVKKLIRLQKLTRQIKGGSIRIEKLVE